MLEAIPSQIIQIALSNAEGVDFERFAQGFFAGLEGLSFSPLGGYADGGADGFARSDIYESERTGIFYQFTVQKDHRVKIRQTVARLRDVGRDPYQLIYATSRVVSKIDQEEDALSDELGLRVRIRDSKYIEHRINENKNTQAAFRNHLARYTEFLKSIGGAQIIGPSSAITDPSVYVFLQQEVANRLGNNALIQTLADSLILWL